MTEINAGQLKRAICDLTTVETIPQGLEVTLPQVYHTGQAVAVVVAQSQDGFVVHDNSYAAMLLSGLGLRPGKRLAEALLPQIAAYGCDLTELRVVRRCHSFSELAFAMAAVGCASRLIADQALKERADIGSSFRQEPYASNRPCLQGI